VVTSEVGVWLRGTPSTEGEQLEWVLGGTILTVLPGQQTADDFDWQQVRTPAGNEGWVAVDFIQIDE
jgi:SH3-like domain-containing protein